MPTVKRRGPHPQDRFLFSPDTIPVLCQAVADLSWLRTRNYSEDSALKLVGDRYQLTARQRSAVGRCACSDQGLRSRSERLISLEEAKGRELSIDGFNLLITLEAAMAGGVLLRGRDGCIRDLSSLHGNYHVLADTLRAIQLVCEVLTASRASRTIWYLDKPVSNSGRLAAQIRSITEQHPGLRTEVRLVADPDPLLLEIPPRQGIVVTSDSLILAGDVCWLNLARQIVEGAIPEANLFDLGPDTSDVPRGTSG